MFVRTHQEIDQRSLDLARAIAEKIDADPARAGLERARRVLDRWETIVYASDLKLWRQLLQRPWAEIREALLHSSEQGQRLRQSSPFCGILSPRERWAIWRRYSSP